MDGLIELPPELTAISEVSEMNAYLATDVLDCPGLMIEATFPHSTVDDYIRETLTTYLRMLQQTSPFLIEYFEKDGMDVIHVTKIPTQYPKGLVGDA